MSSTRTVLFLQHCKSPILFSLSLLTPFTPTFSFQFHCPRGYVFPSDSSTVPSRLPWLAPGTIFHMPSQTALSGYEPSSVPRPQTPHPQQPRHPASDSMEGEQFKNMKHYTHAVYDVGPISRLPQRPCCLPWVSCLSPSPRGPFLTFPAVF